MADVDGEGDPVPEETAAGEPLGAAEEPPAGVLPAAGDSETADSVAADSVAVGSGRWAAASFSAKSCSAWRSSPAVPS